MADSSGAPDSIDAVIQRCLAGDQDAWSQIVRQHWRKVFNIAYKFTGKHDEAEDLTQDVFLKIFKSLNTFDRRANFQTWLVSVSRNLCIDHYRSVRKERETIDRDVDAGELSPASSTKSPFAALEQRDRVELLKKALDQLPPTLRSAVLLRDIQELSYQEIADRLRLPEGTVKSRINRGRTELARHSSVRATGAASLQGSGEGQALPDLQHVRLGQQRQPHLVERSDVLPAAIHPRLRRRKLPGLPMRLHGRDLGGDQRSALLADLVELRRRLGDRVQPGGQDATRDLGHALRR